MAPKHRITETELIRRYGDCPIPPSGILLKNYVKAEAIMCKVPPEERANPAERVAFLADKIGLSLPPDHQ